MDGTVDLHASAVADGRRALLILGRAGAGKSTLAIEMIALGARLVADDRVRLRTDGALLLAEPGQPGWVEARGLGLIRAGAVGGQVPVALAVDLDAAPESRLPGPRHREWLGVAVDVVALPPIAAAATLLLALRHGLADADAPVGPPWQDGATR